MDTTVFYKAIRPNGASFHDPDFRWLPEGWVSGNPIPTDWVVRHPNPGKRIGRSGTRASEYLSVATVPTDCTGFEWPCVLLEVEAVGRVYLDDYYHHKRRVRAARVIRERPAHEVFGPQGAEVVAILERCGRLTAEEIERLRAARDARLTARDARLTARDARLTAWVAARAAGLAARDAGLTAWLTARDAARIAARDAAWDAAQITAWNAAIATLTRDLITPEDYNVLMAAWLEVMGDE